MALLADVAGGIALAGLAVAVIWLRAKPVARLHQKPSPQSQDGSLVFGNSDTDLEDRVNVNRAAAQVTTSTRVPAAHKCWRR